MPDEVTGEIKRKFGALCLELLNVVLAECNFMPGAVPAVVKLKQQPRRVSLGDGDKADRIRGAAELP